MAGMAAAALTAGSRASAETSLYGLIGKMLAKAGKRDVLISYVLAGSGAMPGRLNYRVRACRDFR